MKIGIRQISEKTGFSLATISNALNHKKGVNAQTVETVFQVAKELGYIGEEKVSKIKFVFYKKNGKILDNTPFFSLMIDGFGKECRARGYEMVLCYLDSISEDFEEELHRLLNDLSAAIVLLGTELVENEINMFKKTKCKILVIDNWASDMSLNCVEIDNVDSARLAVNYLISKGHTQIGYLRGDFRIRPFRSRAVGFKLAMDRQNLPVENKYIITVGTCIEDARRDMDYYLKEKPDLPTAFFADNDVIALGAMKALQENGYHVPNDISIVGFDDLPYGEISSPRLTSIRVPKQEIGKLAVDRMIQMLGDGVKHKTKILVGTEFVERDSVREIKNR